MKKGDKVCNIPGGGSNNCFVEGIIIETYSDYPSKENPLIEHKIKGNNGAIYLEYEINLVLKE